MYSLFFFPKLRASTIQWFIIMFPLHCFFWYTQFQEKTNVVAVQALLAYQYTPIQQSRYIHQTKLLLYTKLSTKLPNDLTAQWPTVDGCEIRSSPVKMWKKTSHDFGCGFQPSLWGCGISSTIVLEVICTKWTRFPMWGTTLYQVFFLTMGVSGWEKSWDINYKHNKNHFHLVQDFATIHRQVRQVQRLRVGTVHAGRGLGRVSAQLCLLRGEQKRGNYRMKWVFIGW